MPFYDGGNVFRNFKDIFKDIFGSPTTADPNLNARWSIALLQSPSQALYVGILYLALQAADGYIFTPLVQEKAIKLPPALTVTPVTHQQAVKRGLL